MVEVMRTNDLVRLGWAQALLLDHGIEAIMMDTHASNIEGSVSAIQRRLMAPRADADRARALLREHDPENAAG